MRRTTESSRSAAGPLARALLCTAAVLCFTPGAAAKLPAFTPEQVGGTLRLNFNAEPQTLNPLTSRDAYASYIHDYIFEQLIERNPDTLEWEPMLAERWEVSDDGLTITFHLDPKARFSDGSPVTADDVVFTYETMRNPKIDAFRIASYFQMCEACEKVGERTVRFRWKEPYFKSFEVSGAFLNIIPKRVYAFDDPEEFNNLSTRLVGSGPFLFDRWTKGQELVLVRHDAYWRNQAALARVVYRFILNPRAVVQAFLSGDLDYIALSPEWWVKLRKLKDDPRAGYDFRLMKYSAPGNGYSYIGWQNAKPPFDDPRVRTAMTHLVDRRAVIDKLLYGIGTPVTGPFWTGSLQYDAGLKPYAYDPAEALRLLKQAGWEDRDGDGWLDNAKGERFAFEFTGISDSEFQRDVIRLLTEECRRIGIDVSVRYWEWSVFVTHLDNRSYQATMLAWTGTIEGDPFQVWHSSQIEGRGSNHMSFRNAEADRLIEEARATLDPAKRNALYHRFHRVLHEQQPYTFVEERESLRALAPRLEGVTLHRLGLDTKEWWIPKDKRLGGEGSAP